MADTVTLTLEPRTVLGKKVRKLRRAGIVPVHLYGRNIDPQPLQCESKTLLKVLTQVGMNAPVNVTVAGQDTQQLAFVREIQFDPSRGDMIHVDFLHVELSEEMSASIPIVTVGASPGARAANGSVVQILFSLDVRALPMDMPSEIQADLSVLAAVDDVIRVSSLTIPPNVSVSVEPETMVARIEVVRVEDVVPMAEGEAPIGEGAQQGESPEEG